MLEVRHHWTYVFTCQTNGRQFEPFRQACVCYSRASGDSSWSRSDGGAGEHQQQGHWGNHLEVRWMFRSHGKRRRSRHPSVRPTSVPTKDGTLRVY